jgi:hypothetical protein
MRRIWRTPCIGAFAVLCWCLAANDLSVIMLCGEGEEATWNMCGRSGAGAGAGFGAELAAARARNVLFWMR